MPCIRYWWKEPCERRIGVNNACAELAESAWSLVPRERAATCRTDVKLDVHWRVSVQGAEMCNRDTNQNIHFKNTDARHKPPKDRFFYIWVSHMNNASNSYSKNRETKTASVIMYMVSLSFMWLPLFQATKDTFEENEQSKIILQ